MICIVSESSVDSTSPTTMERTSLGQHLRQWLRQDCHGDIGHSVISDDLCDMFLCRAVPMFIQFRISHLSIHKIVLLYPMKFFLRNLLNFVSCNSFSFWNKIIQYKVQIKASLKMPFSELLWVYPAVVSIWVKVTMDWLKIISHLTGINSEVSNICWVFLRHALFLFSDQIDCPWQISLVRHKICPTSSAEGFLFSF